MTTVARSTASAFPFLVEGTASQAVTLGPQGDLVIVTADWFSAPSGISNTGSALSWSLINNGSWGSYGSNTYIATVTAAAAGQSCTITVTGTQNMIIDELTSGIGATAVWTVTNSAATNPSETTTTCHFPSLATAASGEVCYHGTVWTAYGPSGGTTPVNGAAFTYNTDGTALGVAFSGAVADSTTYQPTATTSSAGANAANGMTLSVAAGAAATTAGLVAAMLI